MVKLDTARFPRAAAYLAGLPQGLASHPDCKVRDVVIEPFTRDFSALAGDPALPVPVAEVLSGRRPVPWVSGVLFQVANLVVRDRGFEDDGAFLDWVGKINTEIFDKPVVRGLMKLVSPTLVVLGATRRWAAFHLGSELAAGRVVESGGRAGTVAHLRYPAGLFSPLFLLGLERAFAAALSASRARDPQVRLRLQGDDGAAEYVVSWRA